MKPFFLAFSAIFFGLSAMAKSFDCLSEDKKVNVLVRSAGTSVEGGIPTTIEIRGKGEPKSYSSCEQRYTQMHDQEMIGISCDLGEHQPSVGMGIFLPELDGFIETADQEVIDLQCR